MAVWDVEKEARVESQVRESSAPQSVSQSRPPGAEERIEAFRALTERFATFAADEGVEVEPYTGDGPTYFAALPGAPQQSVLENFRRYVAVAERTLGEGATLTDERHFLWQMFRRIGVHRSAYLM
mgnify:CR=1 FL=1